MNDFYYLTSDASAVSPLRVVTLYVRPTSLRCLPSATLLYLRQCITYRHFGVARSVVSGEIAFYKDLARLRSSRYFL